MIIDSVCVGAFQVNCYILGEDINSDAIIIDPGDEEDKIRQLLKKYKLKPAFIINTHAHIDHIGCDDRFGVPVYAHKKEIELLRNPGLNLSVLMGMPQSVKSKIITVEEGDIISLGQIQLEVLHIPGHTPGGIALLMKKPKEDIVFTGDSLFFQGIGRTDFPYGDEKLLVKSIKEKLFRLPLDTLVYPGHGPSSTIGKEKSGNPFIN